MIMGINNFYKEVVIKFEDGYNIIKDLHLVMDFISIFDHPCGCYIEKENRLSVTKMNSRYCRPQQEMHQKHIKNKVGYLGLHE